MRKKVYIFLALLSIFIYITSNRQTSEKIQENLTETRNVQSTANTLTYKETTYAIYNQHISDPQYLQLIPNFTDSKTSNNIMKNFGCAYGVNGGFYTIDKKPLGLFFTNGSFQENTVHNQKLFNGFLYKTSTGKLKIDKIPPDFAVEFVFQSGPLFRPGEKLNLTNDEQARRIMIAQTDTGKFYFLAITEYENAHSGPYLADLPDIIQQFNSSQISVDDVHITTILNLDGGSASAYFDSDGKQLSELVSIGSFICSKNP
jgi:uncharacterized protein YigE (DUF2233 family)